VDEVSTKNDSSPLLRLDQGKPGEVQFVMYFKLTSRKTLIKSQKHLKRIEEMKQTHAALRRLLESVHLKVVDLWKSEDGMKYHWGITASEEDLRVHADVTRYELPLNAEFGGGTAPYYASQHQLYHETDGTLFSELDKQRLVMSMISGRRERGGAEVDINFLYRGRVLYKFFPLHDASKQVYLWNEWVKKPWRMQPVNKIREYFGEKVGFYFGFMGYCIKWLMPVSVLGLAIFVLQQLQSKSLQRWAYVGSAAWSILMPLWATLFIEFWKRKSAARAVRWRMDTLDVAEPSKPSYTGHARVGLWWGKTWIDLEQVAKKDPSLARLNIYEAPSKRYWRIVLSSWPILLAMIFLSLAVAAGFIILSALVSSQSQKIGVSVLNGIVIVFLSIIYRGIARFLTERENHRTDTDAEDSLILKIFVFDFVNAFGTIFYQAFLRYNITWKTLGFMNNGTCRYLTGATKFNCVLSEISTLLISVFLVRIFFFQMLDFIIPYLYTKIRVCITRTRIKRKKKSTTESQIQAKMSPFAGTLDEYSGMIMQFGYVTLFAAACPLGPAIALFSFIVETRTDAFKMLKLVQRAPAERAKDIGIYQSVLEFIGYVSIVSNVALIALADHPSPEDLAWRLSLVIIAQNLVVALKFIIAKLVPKIPESAHKLMAKRAFIKEELVGKDTSGLVTRFGMDIEEEMGPDSANESFGSFSQMHKVLADKIGSLSSLWNKSHRSSVNVGDYIDTNRDEDLESSSDDEDGDDASSDLEAGSEKPLLTSSPSIQRRQPGGYGGDS